MITITTQNRLIKTLFDLEVSTTLFLQEWKGMKLHAKVDSQTEKTGDEGCIIERIALLYFNSPANPVMYCISSLYKNQLTGNEYKLLCEKDLPLGKLFIRLNDADSITKQNISIHRETNHGVARHLNVTNEYVYAKKYDYCIGSRQIGQIVEYFNEDSLMRL